MQMKRGHFVLIGGAALFVIGIILTAVWAIPIAQQIQKETANIQAAQLDPEQSRSLSLQVDDTSRPLSIAVNSKNLDAVLAVTVTAPDGQTILNSNLTENTVLSTNPTVAGEYLLEITNTGGSSTIIDVIFGHFPGFEENNQVNFGVFGGVLAGTGMIIAGLLVMIAGVVIWVVDRRRSVRP